MYIRHIEPGSLDWNDAMDEERDRSLKRLDPEELKRLRLLSAAHQMGRMTSPTTRSPSPATAPRP